MQGTRRALFLGSKQRQNAPGIKKRTGEKKWSRLKKQSGSIKDNKCRNTGLIAALHSVLDSNNGRASLFIAGLHHGNQSWRGRRKFPA